MTHSYDNETCHSCTWRAGFHGCKHPGALADHDSDICDNFTPSLQCRQVRALEGIQDILTVNEFVQKDLRWCRIGVTEDDRCNCQQWIESGDGCPGCEHYNMDADK